MSTKMTVAYNNPELPGENPEDSDYHLYLECFEHGAVYLEICGKDLEFEANNNRIMVRIPRDVFDEIASGKYKDTLAKHDKVVEEMIEDRASLEIEKKA